MRYTEKLSFLQNDVLIPHHGINFGDLLPLISVNARQCCHYASLPSSYSLFFFFSLFFHCYHRWKVDIVKFVKNMVTKSENKLRE